MIFAIWKVAGSAFQVTIPAAIYIAALRRMKEYDDFARAFDVMQFGEVDAREDEEGDDDEDDDEDVAKRRKEIEDMFSSKTES